MCAQRVCVPRLKSGPAARQSLVPRSALTVTLSPAVRSWPAFSQLHGAQTDLWWCVAASVRATAQTDDFTQRMERMKKESERQRDAFRSEMEQSEGDRAKANQVAQNEFEKAKRAQEAAIARLEAETGAAHYIPRLVSGPKYSSPPARGLSQAS